MVFLDACHSGGVTTRATPGGKTPGITPKYAARAGGEACERPVNVITRSLGAAARSAGSGANNYVYIAAARDNEVSLDMAQAGGVATQAWRDCINGRALDRDGSGGISAAESRQQCAIRNASMRRSKLRGFLPHHVTISGNENAVLAFSERAREQPAPYLTLKDIYSNRDDRRTVTLTSGKPAFRINQDDVDFTLTTSHAGHLYILMVGSDSKSFDMLFPNGLDSNNAVSAGQTLRLPRSNWMVKANGPAGKNHLLAMRRPTRRATSRKSACGLPGRFRIIPVSKVAVEGHQLRARPRPAPSRRNATGPPRSAIWCCRRNARPARRSYGARRGSVTRRPN